MAYYNPALLETSWSVRTVTERFRDSAQLSGQSECLTNR